MPSIIAPLAAMLRTLGDADSNAVRSYIAELDDIISTSVYAPEADMLAGIAAFLRARLDEMTE